MKQLEMTPQLAEMIKAAVGPDVDPTAFAVFETIALNTQPLPGKDGVLFEKAQVMPLTLAEMVKSINDGNHLPIILNHDMEAIPNGRFFHAGLDYGDDGLELRALFYLDPTETNLITKINAGSLDEVSVSFLSRQFLCSECGWDYFQFGTDQNIWERTCANGHKIGQNGVHGEMVGLNQFIEMSLVVRGAAKKPKIVGRSQAKLAPEALQRLAASGFELDDLVVQASLGTKDNTMDLTAALTQIATLSTDKGQLVAEKAQLSVDLGKANDRVTALTADVTRLTEELNVAKAAKPEGYDDTVAENAAALSFLGEQFDRLTAASGKAKVEGDARPKTVAEFKAKITELTDGLTAILPTGGVSEGLGGVDKKDENTVSLKRAAFSLRNNK